MQTRQKHEVVWRKKTNMFIRRIHPQQIYDITTRVYQHFLTMCDAQLPLVEHYLQTSKKIKTYKETSSIDQFFPHIVEELFTNPKYIDYHLITRFSDKEMSLEIDYRQHTPKDVVLSMSAHPRRVKKTSNNQQVTKIFVAPNQQRIEDTIAFMNTPLRGYRTLQTR